MKKLKIIFLAMLISLFLGCEEDFLNQDNPNLPTVASFWKTEEDAVKGVTGVYAGLQLRGSWKRWILWQTDLRSDEGFSKSPWTDMVAYCKFQMVNYDLQFHSETWYDHYQTIFRANQVLENVPEIDMDETLKQRLLAEAKFIRTFMYYTLWNLWGNVPLVLTVQSTDDRPDFSSADQVFDQIVQDLKEVQAVLPVSYTGSDVGRATKGAATALLAKTYMQKRMWAEAEAELKAVIDLEVYELVSDYRDNFTAENENNIESIWEVQFSGELRGSAEDVVEPGASEGNNRSQFVAPRGMGWSDGQATTWYFERFLEEETVDGELDPRLDASLIFDHQRPDPRNPSQPLDPLNPDTIFWGRGYKDWQNSSSAWGIDEQFFRKYQDTTTPTNYHSPINLRVIRYADILLLYAEVLNELGRTAEAYPYVDQVRQRSNMARLADIKPGMSQEEMRLQLRHERVVELGGEEHRFYDLKRYGLLDSQAEVDVLATHDSDFQTFEVGKSDLLPIPLTELDINPKLKQNPGW